MKNSNKKKIVITVIIAVLLVIGSVVLALFGKGVFGNRKRDNTVSNNSETTSSTAKTNQKDDTASGAFNKNVKWTFDEKTGNLTFSGKGSMVREELDMDNIPWDTNKVKSVEIQNGIEDIESFLFNGIYDGEDNRYVNLESISIPESVTSLGRGAITGLKKIKTIYIPKNVEDISKENFWDCPNLESINVAPENKNYKSIDGVLFAFDETHLIVYPAGKKDKSYVIPDCVTSIYYDAFFHAQLDSITIPANMEEIAFDAFNGCNFKDVYYKGTPEQWSKISSTARGNGPVPELTAKNVNVHFTK